ncbi:MAG: hypothetical protein WCA08_09985 [Desulfoferrobacter sp.]
MNTKTDISRPDPEKLRKIKLRPSGYRLVYEVEEEILRVLVIVVGRRDKGKVYRALSERLKGHKE